jgi:Cu+-exporting ATPase
VIVSALLSAPVVLLAMVPSLQFTYWQWLSLTLAAPVVVWAAFPFHEAAWTNLRHGAATMDTLISMGTLAAFGWSLYALFLGTAGVPGMTHPFEFTISRGDGSGNIYLEAAVVITTFILAGRYFEVRAKRRAGAALRALLELGAKEVSVLREGREQRVRSSSWPSVTCSSSAGDEDRHGRRDRPRAPRRWSASMLTGESVPVELGRRRRRRRDRQRRRRLVVRASRVGSSTPSWRRCAAV